MSLGILHYMYDVFGWNYYEQHILVHGHEVKVGYFDIGEKIKYSKLGEYQKPLAEAVIQKKNKLIFYSEMDDAIAKSIYPIWIKNTDKNGEEHIQELTTSKKKKSLADVGETQAVEDFLNEEIGNIGALPLLDCKVNPLFFEAEMEDRNINEYSKAESGFKLDKQTLIYGILAIIVIIAAYGFMTGNLHL